MRRIEGLIFDPENSFFNTEDVDWKVGPIKKVLFFNNVSNDKKDRAVAGFREESQELGYRLIFPYSRASKSA